jgi:glycolate oxidase
MPERLCMELEISGDVRTDAEALDRYSEDLSHYHVRPSMIAVPEGEDDLVLIADYARKHHVAVTPRGAGSNQSGSAVGSGIIVLFEQMNRVMGWEDSVVRVQPGIVWDVLNAEAAVRGFRIPYDPSSRAFCTIGGNVGTGASGARSFKYGSVDDAIAGIRLVTSEFGVVDTAKPVPGELGDAVMNIRNRIRGDLTARRILQNRRVLKSSSGYNLAAFLDYDDPAEIITHLVTGSVGTLGLFSEIKLACIPVAHETVLYLIFFPSLREAAESALDIRLLEPSALEMLDAYGLGILQAENMVRIPERRNAVLIVEFDDHIGEAETAVARYCAQRSLPYYVTTEPAEQARLWAVREAMLPRIKRELESAGMRFLSFADDLGVPANHLPAFIDDLESIFRREKILVVIYGHAGEGNLHVRPLIEKQNWQATLARLADETFTAALRYGGTISGEHGAGRNRSLYLRTEWGERMYGYLEEVKYLFDPYGIFNPGVLFTRDDAATNLRF